jgi:hypothetical protein
MNDVSLSAFADELEKTAFFGELWNRFTGLFSSDDERVQAKVKRRVDYLFSPKAGPDKWEKFTNNVKSPDFVAQVVKHPNADPKLVVHANSMHELANGSTIGKIHSKRLTGRAYEIKKLPNRLGCTCNDWRFKGSVNPDHDCKHIRAFKSGKVEAPDGVS